MIDLEVKQVISTTLYCFVIKHILNTIRVFKEAKNTSTNILKYFCYVCFFTDLRDTVGSQINETHIFKIMKL